MVLQYDDLAPLNSLTQVGKIRQAMFALFCAEGCKDAACHRASARELLRVRDLSSVIDEIWAALLTGDGGGRWPEWMERASVATPGDSDAIGWGSASPYIQDMGLAVTRAAHVLGDTGVTEAVQAAHDLYEVAEYAFQERFPNLTYDKHADWDALWSDRGMQYVLNALARQLATVRDWQATEPELVAYLKRSAVSVSRQLVVLCFG